MFTTTSGDEITLPSVPQILHGGCPGLGGRCGAGAGVTGAAVVGASVTGAGDVRGVHPQSAAWSVMVAHVSAGKNPICAARSKK